MTRPRLNESQMVGALLVVAIAGVGFLYSLVAKAYLFVPVSVGLMVAGLYLLLGKKPPRGMI